MTSYGPGIIVSKEGKGIVRYGVKLDTHPFRDSILYYYKLEPKRKYK